MCRIRRRHTGIKVMKDDVNKNLGISVRLTKKTVMSGAVRYAVVITQLYSGKRIKLKTFPTIGEAWQLRKVMLTA